MDLKALENLYKNWFPPRQNGVSLHVKDLRKQAEEKVKNELKKIDISNDGFIDEEEKKQEEYQKLLQAARVTDEFIENTYVDDKDILQLTTLRNVIQKGLDEAERKSPPKQSPETKALQRFKEMLKGGVYESIFSKIFKKVEYKNNQIIFTPNDGKQITEKLEIPKGLNIKVIDDKYIMIFDELGKADTAFLVADAIYNDEISFAFEQISEQGTVGSGIETVQRMLNMMIGEAHEKEFSGPHTETITIAPGKEILLRGPNREDGYQLSSGSSTVIYYPKTQEVALGREWFGGGSKSRIVEKNLKDGYIIVEEKEPLGKGEFRIIKWRLDINFGNFNPGSSYTATRLEK